MQGCEQGQGSGPHVLGNDPPTFSLGLETLNEPKVHPAERGVVVRVLTPGAPHLLAGEGCSA